VTESLPGTIPDRLQPHSVEAEQAVLGSLGLDPGLIVKIATVLNPADFYIEKNGWIYSAIHDLWNEGIPADTVTLNDKLEQRGQLAQIEPGYFGDLVNRTPTSFHIGYYAKIVRRMSELRQLGDAAGEIARLSYQDTEDTGEVMGRAEEILFKVTSQDVTNGPRPLRVGIEKHYDRVDYLQNHKGQQIGIPTGLYDLDKLLGGLQRSDMIVMAGRTRMGKTSLALNIALNAAKNYQRRVAVFSLEMSEEQLAQRMISAETGIDSMRLRNGDIKEDEWPVYLQATNMLAALPIFIDDTPAISAYDLRSRARRLQAEHGLDLLIVDYMQLMRGDKKSQNREQEIAGISRTIKAIARELNIPVLALSQLSRRLESRNDKRPMLSDLRESGAIEQDADVVLFIYRDEIYNPDTEFPNIAEIIVSKHRSGPSGVMSAYFKKHLTQFVDLTIEQADPQAWVMEY